MKLWRALVAILLLGRAEGKKKNRGKPQATSSGQQSTAENDILCGSTTNPFNVLVVGLGWAGTNVLKELENYKNFLAAECDSSQQDCDFRFVGVEYEKFVGGRAISAELVSGGGNPITEFMFELFSQNPNAPTRNDERDYILNNAHKWSDIHYVYSNGTEIDSKVVNTDRDAWADAFQCLQEKALLSDNRLRGMDEILDQCKWNEDQQALRKLFRWYELQWEFLHSTENNNGFGNVPLWTYTGEYQDKDLFVSIDGNCARIADALMKKYVEDYRAKLAGGEIPDVVRLNTVVTQIDWEVDPIKVTVEKSDQDDFYPHPCDNYYARRVRTPRLSLLRVSPKCHFLTISIYCLMFLQVVVTASVGMLKKYMDVTPLSNSPFNAPFFDPPLPQEKRDAIVNTFFSDNDNGNERDDMGLYKKLTIQFDKTTWDAFVQQNAPDTEFDFVVPDPSITYSFGPGIGGSDIFCSLWQNLDRGRTEFFYGSRAFVCTLVTKEFEAAVDPVTRILPHGTANEIIKFNLLKGVLGLDDNQISAIGNCARVKGPRGGPLTLFPPEDAQLVDQPWAEYEEYYTSGSENPPLSEANCIYQIFDGPELKFPTGPDDEHRPNLWNGAWPNFMTRWTDEEYDCARANLDRGTKVCEEGVDPVLLFAGDAMCPRFFAFQHGAVQSGIQIANKIVAAELQEFPDDLNKWRSEYETYEGCDDYNAAGGPGNYRKSKSLH